MTYETITFELTEDQVAVLTLNRPEYLNALSAQMLEEILHALSTLGGDNPARALLLTGAGRAFSSGADLQMGSKEALKSFDFGAALLSHYNPIMQALALLPIPVISAVNGPAVGAGMSIALAGDIIVAARSAYFLQAFVNIGLVPDAGSSFILPHLIGPARARALTMLGERLPAETALEWGMLYDVVEDEALPAAGLDLAKRLAAGPTKALGTIRALIRSALENDFNAQMAEESRSQSSMGTTEDCFEGIMAFLEKRPARFKGC